MTDLCGECGRFVRAARGKWNCLKARSRSNQRDRRQDEAGFFDPRRTGGADGAAGWLGGET